ncbi:hypothetical protein [Streptomyces sp. NPDC048606]|uniref:hypothetical protein n=1 Tax=Streptomyces sp. NPDC048606 TaxID=3154726 RepID=UPI003432D9BA
MAIAIGAGGAVGVLGALAAKFDGPLPHVVNLVFAGGWSWACLAFLIGFSRRSKVEASWLPPAALLVGVVVYYTLKALSPVAPIGVHVTGEVTATVSWAGIVFWGMAALLFGAPVGLCGNLARDPGIAGLPFRLLIPLIAYLETSWRAEGEGATAGRFAELTWQTIGVLAAVSAVAIVAHTVWKWSRRLRTTTGRP